MGGKRHQLPPGRGQWCNAVQGGGDGAQFFRLRRTAGKVGRTIPHHAQHLALTQRYAHQGTGGQCPLTSVDQRLRDLTVRWHVQQNRELVSHAKAGVKVLS
jgi:hypothetical protein